MLKKSKVDNADLQATLAELVPRRYQEEVFSRAQKGNIIAAMDTGSGKTLISLLLIKWIASLEQSKGKIVIFLVPKVTLVEQQYTYIKVNSSLRVVKLHGAQELDLSDREGWKARFEGSDVFVMTAQIFLNVITHSLWSINKVSLMIFDECHHARKSHPYNAILREYMQSPVQSRPKIFGMTASPIWDTKDPIGSLSTLEVNLDAKVTAVRENIDELNLHSPRAQELIKEYPFPPEHYDYPSPTIHECLGVIPLSVWNELDIPWTQLSTRYIATFYNLGPYCASLFLYQELQQHVQKVIAESKNTLLEDPDERDMEGILPDFSTPKPSSNQPDDFFLIIDILLDFHPFFPDRIPSSPPTQIPISFDWCTPKVKVLVDILIEYHDCTPGFQCIIFVEQRQYASSLAMLLPNLPGLHGKINCDYLLGNGVGSDGVSKHLSHHQGDPVLLFKQRKINILIATSVAEEGLDFKECDLVVRFDPLHHMVGYVQSRGRARKHGSTFIVMIQEHDTVQLEKYKALKKKEPEVNHVYRTRHIRLHPTSKSEEGENDDDDDSDPIDVLQRERYVVPSTNAVLSYDNALSLLNHLCSLIPRDGFTPMHAPIYTGEYESKLQLPRSLPLSAADLTFQGPLRRSKKEAKRAVAFMAVQRLRELDVFDEYLLPSAKHFDEEGSSNKNQSYLNIKRGDVPIVMQVPVRDPWCIGDKLWLHPVAVNGKVQAGLITGTSMPLEDFFVRGRQVQLLPSNILVLDEDSSHEERMAMDQFTRLAIKYCNTASPFQEFLSFYLVPITEDIEPDFEAITQLIENPRGITDWSGITEDDYDNLIVIPSYRAGSTHLLRRFRYDLTSMSVPPLGSKEANSGASTYHDYWTKKWSSKNRQAIVATDGPLIETYNLSRTFTASYSPDHNDDTFPVHFVNDGRIFPRDSCSWLPLPFALRVVYQVLPVLCQRLTIRYREICARQELGLLRISGKLLTEALTIPSATMPFHNQRLETLGDAVLQVCTTVYLLNKYPTRHEGQLTLLRRRYVKNLYLMHRALDIGLQHYVNSEIPNVYKWRYTLSGTSSSSLDYLWSSDSLPKRVVSREYPRRSLQDCTEAILGASFVSGGIPLALETGTALGLEFGGPLPWFIRYKQLEETPIASLFDSLEESLGYKFKNNMILLESLTHPSFPNSQVPSYQRLEFLGDAILDLAVMVYLYEKFPSATSHQLSLARAKAICAPTLANLAVRRLSLQKLMLVNSMDLTIAIDQYVPILTKTSGTEIIRNGWKFDPPKALSDIFESVIGAVLVDSGYDYEKTAAVVEYVMNDVLEALSLAVEKDPVSELTEWIASMGCPKLTFEKRMKGVGATEREGYAVLVHDVVVAGPIVSASLGVSRFVAAERALATLKNGESTKSLSRLCDCREAMDVLEDFTDNLSSSSEDIEEIVDLLISSDG